MKYDSRERHPSYQRNRVILNFNVINKYAIATKMITWKFFRNAPAGIMEDSVSKSWPIPPLRPRRFVPASYLGITPYGFVRLCPKPGSATVNVLPWPMPGDLTLASPP